MKKPIKRTLLLGFAFALFLSVALSAQSAQAQTDKRTPQNPQPKKIEVVDQSKKIEVVDTRRRAIEIRPTQNALDADDSRSRRRPIPFQPFEMVHPVTRKQFNPNAELRLPSPEPGGKPRVTTVKQFYDELNAFEQELNKRGRSLREPDTFADLKPKFNMQSYQQSLAQNVNPSNFKPSPYLTAPIQVDSKLYISDKTADQGTPEFPAKWVQQSFPNKGRKKFPFLLEVEKGSPQLIKKVEWQVSANSSFTDKKTGFVVPSGWGLSHLGLDIINTKGKAYGYFVIDFGAIPGFDPEPSGEPKNYFVRVIPYDAEGKPFQPSTIAVARYGAKEEYLEVEWTATDSAEGFKLDLPPDSISPFGVYVRGEGFTMTKKLLNTKSAVVPLGVEASGYATVGVRAFNFLSIVDSKAPKNFEKDVLKLSFWTIAGKNANKLPDRLELDITLFGQSLPGMPIKPTPNGSTVSLNYKPKEEFTEPLINIWFSIGPVPIHIEAELTGEVGVNMEGAVDFQSKQITGRINPYVHTAFTGRGGVDAVIAYAKLEATMNPLFNADFYVDFNSKSSDLVSMTKDIKYLQGNVSLVAGFYYPCPSLKKIVGFITGDEPLPLCEQKWQYDIFEFPKK